MNFTPQKKMRNKKELIKTLCLAFLFGPKPNTKPTNGQPTNIFAEETKRN